MSAEHYLNGYGQVRTMPAPRRVFAAVAFTPASPSPRAWNHPLAAMATGLFGSLLLNTTEGAPATAGILFFASMLVVAAVCALNRYCWSVSKVKAADEAVWVARQSGYRFDGDAQALRWLDADGVVRVARLMPFRGAWDLQLQDAGYAQAQAA